MWVRPSIHRVRHGARNSEQVRYTGNLAFDVGAESERLEDAVVSLVTASSTIAARVRSRDGAFPRKVGKYRVLLELGRGGMASVYLAVAESAAGVSKLLVLKSLLPEYASEPEACAMFLDEARLAVQLNHGNVVQTYDVGLEENRQVIVMEYLEGQTLAGVLKRVHKRGLALPLELHLRVLMRVLEGLHYTHELRGYDGTPLEPVHRDVSPQNVFITYDGRVKVLDFGIAKATSSTTHTATGVTKGKIAYMAPEQMDGSPVDRRADIYAAGCMLWAAAAGRKLWVDLTDVQIMHQVVQNAIPSPRSHNPECDAELERIVMKALSRTETRYASALELHDDLERFCESRGLSDRPRDLARFVFELFEQDRLALKERIELELTQLRASMAPGMADAPLDASVPADIDPQQLTAATQTISASTVIAVPHPARQKRLVWTSALLGAAALLGVVYWALPRRPVPVDIDADSRSASKTAAAAEPGRDTVAIELLVKPVNAQLYLDDQAVQGNPARQSLLRDGKVHRVRAELAGHQTAYTEIASNRDQVVELTLEPLPTPPKPEKSSSAFRPASRKPASKSTSHAPPVATSAGRCAQPFYVDSDGIKKVKPGCL